jgi:transcriptional regulator GlxA family with amidase domain
MHAVLAASGPRLTVSAVARALALSPRSLQRYLRAAGTGFRKEIERALVELARDLLEQRELDLRAIAGRLGFSSADELTRFFRRSTGLTPAEWRDPEGTGAPIDERA